MNPTYVLIEKTRIELENYYKKTINHRELSSYLKFNERFLTTKFYRMRKGSPENLKYSAFLKLRTNIFQLTHNHISKDLRDYLQYYDKHLRNLKDFAHSNYRIKQFSPFFNQNYFSEINTKEKAYWLGFIYADGAITETFNKARRNKNSRRIKLAQNKKDKILIYRFARAIGINFKHIHYYEKFDYYELQIRNHQMIDDLIKKGVIPRKSKLIELPKLKNRKLTLAFLLGYFDGDGEMNSTRMHSGSKLFLEQIKNTFKINHKIKIDTKKSKKGIIQYCYAISLGAVLFNEMLDNYTRSLKRKRKYFRI